MPHHQPPTFNTPFAMQIQRAALTTCLALAVSGCATVQYGDKSTEANLRNLAPVPGRTSLYVCREAAAFLGAGNRTTVFVNNRPIGTLKPSNFAHVILEPGTHNVYIKRSPGGDSGVLTVSSKADEVVILWVGITGGGFGTLTVDNFSTKAEAQGCVQAAEYAVPADS